ncbi:MAG: ribosome silencing factor [Thermovirgaceae bacterium]
MQTSEAANLKELVALLSDRHGERIAVIDLEGQSTIADCLVLVSGKSDIHMRTLKDYVADYLEEKNLDFYVEGEKSPRWILIDAGDFVVNIFSRKGREFYRLESIWADAPIEYFGEDDDEDDEKPDVFQDL